MAVVDKLWICLLLYSDLAGKLTIRVFINLTKMAAATFQIYPLKNNFFLSPSCWISSQTRSVVLTKEEWDSKLINKFVLVDDSAICN